MEFAVETKRELNRTVLNVRIPGVYAEEYQLRMIRENEVPGLLAVSARGEDNQTLYEYEITGLISMKQTYRQKRITREEMQEFLRQTQEVVLAAEKYLLNANRLMLDPAYIFLKGAEYQFCYFPQSKDDIRSSFHRLMEEFVQWTDYQDISSVKTAFLLHRETMKENYSLQGIMRQLEEEAQETEPVDYGKDIEEPEGEGAVESEEQPKELSDVEGDWVTKQEMGARIMRETDNLWTPIKHLLQKHKRPKWGDWDGIYIDEEEL